jgi:hypothetical protein
MTATNSERNKIRFVVITKLSDGAYVAAPEVFESKQRAATWAKIESTQMEWEHVIDWQVTPVEVRL